MKRSPKPGKQSLAYLDQVFLGSAAARPLRILAEYLDPIDAFRREKVRDTIVFFGSARIRESGAMKQYYEDARELARLITCWTQGLPSGDSRYVVCSGGGGGIMEAANRGAHDAGGRSVGLNISLPHERGPNRYVTKALSFEFHYFFMRKLWFAHLARALFVFPGGFGTLDELTEILTLMQTQKLERRIPILLYGQSYWQEIINLKALARHGMIGREDLKLFTYVDSPAAALRRLKQILKPDRSAETPAFAHSRSRKAR